MSQEGPSESVVDVSSAINQATLRPIHYIVFLLCGLVAVMDGYDSVVIGITAPSVAASLAIDLKSFGPIFAAAQFGFMAGAFIAGPVADRRGRKGTLLVSILLFGIATLLTALSSTFLELVAYRFVTGLGLGGAATCFVILASEYAPQRLRGTVVACLWMLVPAGNVVGGVLASALIPRGGWTSVYWVGGALPLLFGLLIFLLVPESIAFLVIKDPADRRIPKVLERIAPNLRLAGTRFITSEQKFAGSVVRNLFGPSYLTTTICLWIAYFFTWLILITTLAWTASLVHQAGLSMSDASLMVACCSTGGVSGGLIIGRIIDLTDKHLTIVAFLILGSIAIASFGLVSPSFYELGVLAFAQGVFFGGSSSGLTALAALSYPTVLRSTGVGWAIAMARLGSALGPLAVGAIISHGGGRLHVYGGMAICALVAATSVLVLRGLSRRPLQTVPA